MVDDIFKGIGVEIDLAEQDDFLKVRETLTRIGVSSRKEKVLYQSCHILHKQGQYYIVHFKELLMESHQTYQKMIFNEEMLLLTSLKNGV